jgi:alkylated DNA nucleotide flippase Atl1
MGPVTAWLDEDPRRARATWQNDRRHPLVWEADAQGYRPTPLVQQMFNECGLLLRTTRGPKWWLLPDGRSLPQAAGTARRGFDWTSLHDALTALPEGRWTSYGDLAELIGTAPQPTGQHIAGCEECENAWRVLGNNGRSRPSFAWSDPADHRTQEEALTSEGVSFVDGVADPSQRLDADDLADMAPED